MAWNKPHRSSYLCGSGGKNVKSYFPVFLLFVFVVAATGCASRNLNDEEISACLARTDFPGYDAKLRSAIGWHIDYDRKVRETKCCALEPRAQVLAKGRNLSSFKSELMNRIDRIEAGADSLQRSELSKYDRCYRSLMDLYWDTRSAVDAR